MTFLKSYLALVLPLLFLDYLWLTTMVSRFYRVQLKGLFLEDVRMWPIVLFYLLYPVGLAITVLMPAQEGNWSLQRVFLQGALIGFMAYGAYNFTNHATLSKWTTAVTLVDLTWGTVLTGLCCLVAYYWLR